MDPLTASLFASSAANLVGGLIAPGGDNVEGFESIPVTTEAGVGQLTPAELLGRGVSATGRALDFAEDRLAQPVSVAGAVAQTPPSFSGGGLPMDIGVTGRDPALSDPSLLTLPGLSFGGTGGAAGNPLDVPGSAEPFQRRQIHPTDPSITVPGSTGEDTGRIAVPRGTATPDAPSPGSPTTGTSDAGLARRRLSAGLAPSRTTTPGTSSEDLIGSQAEQAQAALFLLQAARGGVAA